MTKNYILVGAIISFFFFMGLYWPGKTSLKKEVPPELTHIEEELSPIEKSMANKDPISMEEAITIIKEARVYINQSQILDATRKSRISEKVAEVFSDTLMVRAWKACGSPDINFDCCFQQTIAITDIGGISLSQCYEGSILDLKRELLKQFGIYSKMQTPPNSYEENKVK